MFVEATAAYYHPGNWTITQIRNELVMQGMKKSDAEKRIASELGVTKRSVERYLQSETEGSSKQARGKKSLMQRRAQINELGNKILRPKGKKDGVTIKVDGKIKVRSSKKKKEDDERDREISWDLDWSEWNKLAEIAQEDGEQAAQEYFFGDVYGVPDMSLVNGTVAIT